MKDVLPVRRCCCLALLGTLCCPLGAKAQFFSYNLYGDTLLGFRKTGAHQGTYELVVNVGVITNLVGLSAGTSINITRYSTNQLADAFPDGFQDLQWSASAAFPGSAAWAGYPKATLWCSVPAGSPSNPSQAPVRNSANAQSILQKRIQGLGQGAGTISSGLGATNADNNVLLVREPYDANSLNDLSYFIGDASDPTLGDFGGSVLSSSIENVVPDSFSSPARLDLYQSVPNGFVDPSTGSTGPLAYLVGYFLLNPDGTMTFTRASSVTPPPPPAAPTLVSVSRLADTSTIYFTTTNGATYTLYYTNAAGLGTPVSAWPTAAATVTGDGTVKSLTDTTGDGERYYAVGAK